MTRKHPAVAFLTRLLALARKEVIHILRDARVIYMALGFPVVLLLLFGYAVSFDLDRLPVGVVDQDQSPESRKLVDTLTASGSFVVTQFFRTPEEAQVWFRQGKLKVALVIPKDFGKRLARGETSDAQVLLDGADGNTARIALGYTAGIGQAYSRTLLEDSGALAQMAIQDRVRFRFNPGMRSAAFIVPGLIAMILSIMAVLLTALTVAREWERGSMEQLFATPVGRLEIILGKLAPYVVIGMVQVLLVLTLGTVLFDVPVHGSVTLLFGASALFLAGMLGQGLFISVATRNQQVATQLGVITSMLPTMLLSGFLFPVENMPLPLRVVSTFIPSKYFIAVLRGVMLKGNGLDVQWKNLVAMGAFALLMVVISSAKFRRRLD